MRVALVVMPFGSAERPSLGVGLLKAALQARGISCETRYLPFLFSQLAGHRAYARFADEMPMTVQAGEWVFSRQLHGEQLSSWSSFEHEVLDHPRWGLRSPTLRAMIQKFLAIAPVFLERALAEGDWGRFDVVGFSSSFQQTFASLCLARLVKERYPHVRIVLGGPNFEGPLGRVYIERFPFVDFVCTGEGDVAFPELCEELARGGSRVPDGIVSRRDGRPFPEAGATTSESPDLDTLPFADHDDFVRLHDATFERRESPLMIPIEASRGCWWGQASHCCFCSLNGEKLTYRRRSTARVLADLDALERRYRPDLVQFTDNVLDTRASSDFLTGLAARNGGVAKFFEVRSTLSRGELHLLKKAGVRAVQVGVESLCNTTLREMKKGVTAARNVTFLRWAKEAGLVARWNILHGFPGEDPAELGLALDVARKLVHLDPPSTCSPMRLDRFSPSFERWRERGFTDVRPLPCYRHLYPFAEEELGLVAYFFDYDHPGREEAWKAADPLEDFVETWQEKARAGSSGTFEVLPRLFGGWVLLDRRFGRPENHLPLEDQHVALLLACDAPRPRESAVAAALEALPGLQRAKVEGGLADLIARDAIVSLGNHLVTLPILPPDLAAGMLKRP